jgi:hypothetical protein
MTDKELLELAAKAAGIEIQWPSMGDASCRRTDTWDIWNPLTDDGDALRLAVKLKICIGPNFDNDCAVADGGDFSEHHAVEMHNNDPYAATRRAITRAAAAIGEGMK